MSKDEIIVTKQIAAELKQHVCTVRRNFKAGLLPDAWQTKKGTSIKMRRADLKKLKGGK